MFDRAVKVATSRVAGEIRTGANPVASKNLTTYSKQIKIAIIKQFFM
jgi:hypothetical protein